MRLVAVGSATEMSRMRGCVVEIVEEVSTELPQCNGFSWSCT